MSVSLVNAESIGSYFECLSDPRHTRNRRHLLGDVIVVIICGMICGCDGPTAIHRWASHRADWLRTFLALPNGVPSRDCMRRLLLALSPEAFQKCFQQWIADALQPTADGSLRLVAIDGKTCRGSHDAAKGWGPLHIVSAWASEEGINQPGEFKIYRECTRRDGTRYGVTGHFKTDMLWSLQNRQVNE